MGTCRGGGLMKFLVTDIEFDGLDEVGDGIPEFQLSEREKIEIRDQHLGQYEADNENDVIDLITEKSGYYVTNIYFK